MRQKLTIAKASAVHLVPVHEDHTLVFVGEDPGAKGDSRLPLYPHPRFSTGGRLCELTGMCRQQYLETFGRADLLSDYPGPSWPSQKAREAAPALASRVAPRPLILLGRAVSQAFQLPSQEWMTWHDYLLDGVIIRAAAIPHPSGRNPYYRHYARREAVVKWLKEQVEAHKAT